MFRSYNLRGGPAAIAVEVDGTVASAPCGGAPPARGRRPRDDQARASGPPPSVPHRVAGRAQHRVAGRTVTIPDPASSSHESLESLVREIAFESFGVSIGVGIDSPVFGTGSWR